MFTGQVIAVVFVLTFASLFPLPRWPRAEGVVEAFWLAAGMYLLAAGVIGLMDGWMGQAAEHADPAMVARIAGHEPGEGLLILAIYYWPYVLIGLGGMIGILGGVGLRQRFRGRRVVATDGGSAGRR
jgi:hypothetical protein